MSASPAQAAPSSRKPVRAPARGPSPEPAEPGERAFRPMQASDVDRVLEVEVQAYGFPWSRGNFIDSLAAGHWAELMESPDGDLIGYWLAMKSVDEVHLLNLTVAPGHQRQGHALTLMKRLQARAQAEGQASLWLEVRVGNERARRLYERLGFEQRGLRRGYYPAASSRREDAVVMALALQRESADGA